MINFSTVLLLLPHFIYGIRSEKRIRNFQSLQQSSVCDLGRSEAESSAQTAKISEETAEASSL